MRPKSPPHPRLAFAFLLLLLSGPRSHSADRLIVDGTINNHPVHFFYDTGSSDPIIFRDAAEKIGLKIVKNDGGKPPFGINHTPLDFAKDCSVSFFGATRTLNLLVLDHHLTIKEDIHGVLSWSDTADHALQINLEKSRTSLLDPPTDLTGWKKWRLVPGARVLIFECPGESGMCRIGIDTGAPQGIILTSEKWHAWRDPRANAPATNAALINALNKTFVFEILRAKKFTVGGLTFLDIPVTQSTRTSETTFEHCDAILGLSALEQMKIVIDQKNGFLYTAPITPRESFGYNRLGAVFVEGEGAQSTDLLARVTKDSPAEKAGIRENDILVTLDNVDAATWQKHIDAKSMHSALSQPAGTKLTLTLKRDGRTFDLTVTLQDPTPVD